MTKRKKMYAGLVLAGVAILIMVFYNAVIEKHIPQKNKKRDFSRLLLALGVVGLLYPLTTGFKSIKQTWGRYYYIWIMSAVVMLVGIKQAAF